jgi:LEA14-like dessication related protein
VTEEFKAVRALYLIVILVLFGVAIYVALLFYTGTLSEVTDVTIENISNVSNAGFTLNGGLTIKNGGVLALHVDHIEYNLSMERESLGVGDIDGGTVEPHTEQRFVFHHTVNATRVLGQKLTLNASNTNVHVSGDVVLVHFGLLRTRIPFSADFDLLGVIANGAEQFAQGTQNAVDTILGGLGKLFS